MPGGAPANAPIPTSPGWAKSRIFLSHANADNAQVLAVAEWLEQQGWIAARRWRVWCHRTGLVRLGEERPPDAAVSVWN